MKHSLMRGLIGSLLALTCSITFAEQATLELKQGPANNLSGYNSNGAINAESAYSADQADPNALPDTASNTPSPDSTESAAMSEPPEAAAVWVTIQGTVRNDNNNLVCAMALANGQYMFTCNPLGAYGLTVPLDNNNQIDLQVFAAGHMPFRQKLPSNQAYYGVILEVAEDCEPPTPYCGDLICGVGENYTNCPQDCGPPTPYCGDLICGVGEDYQNCPQDCTPPPPATSNFTITLVDRCIDGFNIDYKYYDFINNKVWPTNTTHWVTPGYGLNSTHTLVCQDSGQVCIGARAGNGYWGVDVDGSETCTNCCLPCQTTSMTINLTCP